MITRQQIRLGRGLIPISIFLVLVGGCKDQRRHKASEEVEVADVQTPVPDSAAPAEVVKALLSAIKELQHIRAAGLGRSGNQHEYDVAVGTIESLTAQERLYQMVHTQQSLMIPRDIDPKAALRLVVESWTSVVAHYVDGFLLDTLSTSLNPKGDEATVHLQVENPEEHKLLEQIESSPDITGAKDENGRPLSPGNPAYLQRVRSKSLAMGFNIPIRKQLTIVLRQVDGAWRAYRLALGPVFITSRFDSSPPIATSVPAPTTGVNSASPQ